MNPIGNVKCVAWDLDNTLWRGTALETADGLPEVDERTLAAIDELERRGVLNSIASRNPREIVELVERHPGLCGRFVAPQLGWGRKSGALRRLTEELRIGFDTVLLVDDDPFERAEVEHSLGVTAVTREELLALLAVLPSFAPTAEARTRAASYRAADQRRAAAAAHDGSYESFLRECRIEAVLAPATSGDAERLAELAARTNQYNSTRLCIDRADFLARIDSPDHLVATMRLRDRFADDGLVASAVVSAYGSQQPNVDLICVSCRTIGRGGALILLTGLLAAARAHGATTLAVPCRLDERNLPLRIALRMAGFRAASGESRGGLAVYTTTVEPPRPYPEWLTVRDALGSATG